VGGARRKATMQDRRPLMSRPTVMAAIVVSERWGRTPEERQALETVVFGGVASRTTEGEVLAFLEGIRQRLRPDLPTVYAQVDTLLAQLGLEPLLPTVAQKAQPNTGHQGRRS
jgi:hypothetical protein